MSLCLAAPALAEPKYTPKHIPKCNKVMVDKTMCCTYSLEDVKQLYKVDAAYDALKKKDAQKSQKIKLQGSIIEKLNKQLTLSQANTKLVTDRSKELTERLLKTDKELQYEKVKPRIGSYIAWGSVIVLGGVLGGYIIADRLNK